MKDIQLLNVKTLLENNKYNEAMEVLSYSTNRNGDFYKQFLYATMIAFEIDRIEESNEILKSF